MQQVCSLEFTAHNKRNNAKHILLFKSIWIPVWILQLHLTGCQGCNLHPADFLHSGTYFLHTEEFFCKGSWEQVSNWPCFKSRRTVNNTLHIQYIRELAALDFCTDKDWENGNLKRRSLRRFFRIYSWSLRMYCILKLPLKRYKYLEQKK